MIHESTRYAISICPECDEVIRKKLSIFDFPASRGCRVTCSCGSVVWEAKPAKDKYRITVNCPACDEHHTYTMSKQNFWGKSYFSFNCPNWEVGVLYFGDDEKYLESQMTAQSDSINDMFSRFIDENDEVEIMYEMVECINDLAKSESVKCLCGNADITMLIDEEKLLLECKNCGRKKIFEPTEENIDLLYETSIIMLDDTK